MAGGIIFNRFEGFKNHENEEQGHEDTIGTFPSQSAVDKAKGEGGSVRLLCQRREMSFDFE